MEWVKQEDAQGCAIAVAAMMCGLAYQEAKAHFLKRQTDAGKRCIGGYEFHEFLKGRGWDYVFYACRYRTYSSLGKSQTQTWPPSRERLFEEEGLDLVSCHVMPAPGSDLAHAVLMLPDGRIMDPERSDPVASLDFYPETLYVTGWKKIPI